MKRLVLLTTLLLTLLSGLSMATPQRAQAQTFSCSNVTEIPTAECNELVTFFNSTGGANWKNNTGWLSTNTPCSWFGITCNAGHVHAIVLDDNGNTSDKIYGNNLIGTIPNLNLPNLEFLNLSLNQLSGIIPNFNNLPNLIFLGLGSNKLSGTLPDFNNLPKLQGLNLDANQLSGNIPNFDNLLNITRIYLHSNQLSGTIPDFSNLPNLAILNLGSNQLNGTVPNFSNLPKLTILYLYSNQLSGTIPNFSNLLNLTILGLDANQLSGNIPAFSNLPNLTELYLQSNQLSGMVPNLNWGSFSYLKLNNNCGLIAFDTAQSTVLTSKDPTWQVRNSICAVTPTPTATTRPTNTPTATTRPTNTPTPTTIPPTSTPGPTLGDAYEADNSCAEATTITTDGLAQSHTFHAAGDEDWVKFEGEANVTYLIDAGVPEDSAADVVLVTYDKCNGNPTANDSFNPEIHLQFKAPSTGTYFMRVTNQESALGGEKFSYQLAVRQLANQASPGAVVIVAGKLKANDPLQANIHQVTNQVYQLFTRYGYESERIYYLANDLKLNPDNDSTTQDVDDLAQRATLQRAITEWAVDKVGPERAFTLYMMDHGAEDRFYLNGREQVVSPDEVNTWLNALEAAAPGVRVNVIIDACYSGSFIKGTQRLGKAGRVIIASTTDQTSAYASPLKGAIFSDMFLQGLDQKLSLYDSFMEGHRVAKVWHPEQVAWLDGNGNGIPNEAADFVVAQQRGFAYAGSLADDLYAPYIATATGPLKVENGQGTVTAQISDDVSGAKLDVWAVVYKPSYVPPQSEELVADMENLPTIKLNGPDSNQLYRGLYEGFNESGTYRLVIYAKDEDGLLSRPREVIVMVGGAKVYLPVVVK